MKTNIIIRKKGIKIKRKDFLKIESTVVHFQNTVFGFHWNVRANHEHLELYNLHSIISKRKLFLHHSQFQNY